MDSNTTEKKEKPKPISPIWQYIIIAALVVFFLFICPRYIYGTTIVDGSSMENTLNSKDLIFHEMVSYHFHNPQRFDVVRINSPIEEDAYWVKRIIGLPGETIQIKDGKVYINDKELKGDVYGNVPIEYSGIAKKPYRIPKEHYFLIGDNRKSDISWDSRYKEIGAISKENINAKMLFRFYPFDSIGVIK